MQCNFSNFKEKRCIFFKRCTSKMHLQKVQFSYKIGKFNYLVHIILKNTLNLCVRCIFISLLSGNVQKHAYQNKITRFTANFDDSSTKITYFIQKMYTFRLKIRCIFMMTSAVLHLNCTSAKCTFYDFRGAGGTAPAPRHLGA